MKVKDSNQSKLTTKHNKKGNFTELAVPKVKIAPTSIEQQHLSPMHIKTSKIKSVGKKKLKETKNITLSQQKTTKRKDKESINEMNRTLILDDIELKQTVKENKEYKLRNKYADKTIRHCPKTNKKCKEWLISDLLKSKQESLQKRCRQQRSKQIYMNMPQEEYLFIGEDCFLINNYCPTKRLLNTYRQACVSEKLESKFIMQDRERPVKQRIQSKKTNIFQAAKRQIQLKNKTKNVIIIQKWWRKLLAKNNLFNQKSNPEILKQVHNSPANLDFSLNQSDLNTSIKPYQTEISMVKNSPFDVAQVKSKLNEDLTKILPDDQINVVSFNSTEMMEEKPKKIQFKKEDISKMMMVQYKLPQRQDVDHHQNQSIFNSYTKFRINEVNCDEQATSSQEFITSPLKQELTTVQDTNFDLMKEFEQATKVKECIENRISSQKGQVKNMEILTTQMGISTSILSIHNFLIKFFQFYIQNFKQEFLNLINMPFGFSISARLNAIGGTPLPQYVQQDEYGILYGLKYIIDDDKLLNYYKFLEQRQNKSNNSFLKANYQLEKIHHKAVLDYFNEQLNYYRPYRLINGVPYPWNHSYKALTFYSVSEDNISQVFEKVQLKLLKSSSLLCGILVKNQQIYKKKQSGQLQFVEFMEQYEKNNHGLILQHNQNREKKIIHQELKLQTFQYDFELYTSLLVEISNQIFEDLIVQNTLYLHGVFEQTQIY